MYKETYDSFVDNDPSIFVINCKQEEVDTFLKLAYLFLQKKNTIFILDDCAA